MTAKKQPRDPATISYTMSRIRSKDTKPERVLRRALWASGIRFRKHYSRAPGSPDIAIVGHRIAVFCDGVFWHGKDWEKRRRRIRSNRSYWLKKIRRNMARDRRINAELASAGWRVIRFWDTDILKDTAKCVSKTLALLQKELEANPPRRGL